MDPVDLILHLIGEQNIPNYVAIKHLPAQRHLLLATEKTRRTAERLKRVCADVTVEIQLVDAFDTGKLKAAYQLLAEQLRGQRFYANITGGTKMMSILLVQMLTREFPEAKLFYVETGEKKELLELTTEAHQPLQPTIQDIQTFISLQSDTPPLRFNEDYTTTEYNLSKLLWDEHGRPGFQALVGDFAQLTKEGSSPDPSKVGKLVSRMAARFRATMLEERLEKYYDECQDCLFHLCEFLGGKWFELYTYTQINENKRFRESILALSRSASIPTEGNKNQDKQELDLVYTDGFYLYIIECKSGKFDQSSVQKLENVVKAYGGTFGRGILVAAQQQTNQALLDRVGQSTNMMLVDGTVLDHPNGLIEALKQWHPGVRQ